MAAKDREPKVQVWAVLVAALYLVSQINTLVRVTNPRTSKGSIMKATRLFLAALALAIASACTSANITGPSDSEAQPNQTQVARGQIGSGN
jgi:hypothetical protein